MINYISSWSRQIILAVIISIILEMILIKDSTSSKYVKTIIGIYIMYIIVAPGLKLIGSKSIDFENINYEGYLSKSNTYKKFETNIKDRGIININDKYELNLKQDIEKKLREKGYIVSNIKLKLNMNLTSELYGQIEKIEIKLSKVNKDQKKDINEQNKISIKIKDNRKETENEEDLINFLSSEYGVEKDNIVLK